MSAQDSVSFAITTRQYVPEKPQTVRTDTTNVKKKDDVFTESKAKVKETSTPSPSADTSRVSQHVATYNKPKSAPKPAPKPETGIKTTSSNSVQTSELPTGEARTTVVGSFDTNLPTFNELNIKSKVGCAEASGVGIYSTREASEKQGTPTVEHFDGPPAYDTVTFESGTPQVKIPQQEAPVKGSIVFNPDTRTYAFNNIEGLEIIANPDPDKSRRDADGNRIAGGEKILVSGGSVAKLDTGEQDATYKIVNENGSLRGHYEEHLGTTKGGQSVTGLPQTIVLQNTEVQEGVINISNDRLVAIDTDLSSAEITTPGNVFQSQVAVIDSSGKKQLEAPKNTFNLQTGFTGTQAMSEWLNGGDVSSLVAEQSDTKGTVKIDNEIFKNVNMENATVARTVGNLNIYNTDSDGSQVHVQEAGDKIKLGIPGADITISANQPKDAKIFFDAESHTIVMENVQGIEVNPDDKNLGNQIHKNMSVKLFLNDCQVDYLSTIDTHKANSNGVTADVAQGRATQSDIVLAGNTSVADMHTSYDNVYVTGDASVDKLSTTGDNVHTFGNNAKINGTDRVVPSNLTLSSPDYITRITKHDA